MDKKATATSALSQKYVIIIVITLIALISIAVAVQMSGMFNSTTP